MAATAMSTRATLLRRLAHQQQRCRFLDRRYPRPQLLGSYFFVSSSPLSNARLQQRVFRSSSTLLRRDTAAGCSSSSSFARHLSGSGYGVGYYGGVGSVPVPQPIIIHQRRNYLFLPTSWTELKLRWQSFQERTIPVRVLQSQHQMKQQLRDTRKRLQVQAKERVKSARTKAVAYSREKVGNWVSAKRVQLTARRKAYRLHLQQRSTAFRQRLRARTWLFFQTKMQSLRLRTTGFFKAKAIATSPLRLRLQARSVRFRAKVMQSLRLANKSFQGRIIGYTTDKNLMNSTTTSTALDHHQLHQHQPNAQISNITLKEYSEADWFDDVGRPLTSKDATGRFVNPWQSQSTSGVHSLSRILQWRYERLKREYAIYGWRVILPSFWKGVPSKATLESMAAVASLPNLKPIQPAALQLVPTFHDAIDNNHDNDDGNPNKRNGIGNERNRSNNSTGSSGASSTDIRCTWLGHSTCLVQQGNLTILTDPMFSERASPFQNVPVGIARDVPPIFTVRDLFPDNSIDMCLITHDHYDHLDVGSVLQLQDKVAGPWIVPRGVGDFLQQRCGIPRKSIVELEWWETVRLEQKQRQRQRSGVQQQQQQQQKQHNQNKSDKGVLWRAEQFSFVGDLPVHPARAASSSSSTSNDSKNNAVWVTCCPVQHWAGRTMLDRNFRLWCSFAVFFPINSGGGTFYFAGDTALPAEFPLFEQISEHVGPIDLAALPIGAYQPDWFMRDSHMNPTEAVRVHQKLNIAKSLGIHWGTFHLSEEPLSEPPQWLQQEAKKAGVEKDFVTIPHGASISVPCRQHQQQQQQQQQELLSSSSSYEWIVE